MGKLMPSVYRKRRFCSRKCQSQHINSSPEHRLKLSRAMKLASKEGRAKGWIIRGRVDISYAEQFFIRVLTERGITYERELKCGPYWIDFAIILANGFKIALEIDGKQHQEWARERVDRRKTLYAESQGWNVYRIPWVSINTERGKEQMKMEIDRFLAYIRGMSDFSQP